MKKTKEKNALSIEKKFKIELSKVLKNEKTIKSQDGKQKYILNSDETFRKIYVSPNNKRALYSKLRSEFRKNLFIGTKGTLLKLSNDNKIIFLQNSDKSNERKTYKLYMKSLNDRKNIRDYQLMAFVFESPVTENAKKTLIDYGIKALSMGVEVHHIEGKMNNEYEKLLILLNTEHYILHEGRSNSHEENISKLINVHNVFDNNMIVITNQEYNINNTQNKHLSNFSTIFSINNEEDIKHLTNYINEFFKKRYEIIQIVFNDEVKKLYIDKNTKEGYILDENHNIIANFSKESMEL